MSFLGRAAPLTNFPSFLLPSLPFRRRKSSIDSASTVASTSSILSEDTPQGPSPFQLRGHVSYLRCGRCAVDLCLTTAIVSRGFTGRWGRAYLVSAPGIVDDDPGANRVTEPHALPNTHLHRAVPRQLVTGGHTVSDVSCESCGNVLGWKYVAAEEESQQYKVGKFILETKRVSVAADWEQGGNGYSDMPPASLATSTGGCEAVEFDSQDEDECEDLFAGAWTPSLATSRRRTKRFSNDGNRRYRGPG